MYIEMTEERRLEMEPLSPHARFEIDFDLEGEAYALKLESLLETCIIEADKRNKRVNAVNLSPNTGDQGGMGYCYINSVFMGGCKLYWFDGVSEKAFWGTKKGLFFRDHEDMGVETVNSIFLLAEYFAEFLKRQNIPFILYARRRTDRGEFVREKFPK